MNKKTVIGLAMLSILLLAPEAQAKDWGKKSGPDKCQKKIMSKIVKQLGLTPEQETAIKDQRQSTYQQEKEIRTSLKQAQKDLREELDRENIDRAKIDAAAGRIKELEAKKTDNRIEAVLSMRSILTPEQYTKLQEKKKCYRQQRRECRGKYNKVRSWFNRRKQKHGEE